jgi:ketosteroid isomerase-like protein
LLGPKDRDNLEDLDPGLALDAVGVRDGGGEIRLAELAHRIFVLPDVDTAVLAGPLLLDIELLSKPRQRLVLRGCTHSSEEGRRWRGETRTRYDWHWDIEELIDAGDRVPMVVREFARGKESGVEVVQQTFWVYTPRGGQIVHAKVLVDKSQALEAAGLPE